MNRNFFVTFLVGVDFIKNLAFLALILSSLKAKFGIFVCPISFHYAGSCQNFRAFALRD
jgi:hypothetical protein